MKPTFVEATAGKQESEGMKLLFKYLILCSMCAQLVLGVPLRAHAAAPDELRAMIDEKNKALQAINAKLEEARRARDAAQNEGRTLSQDVKRLNNNIEQLTLSIKSSELTINKLTLELESVNYDITDVKSTILKNRDAIAELLRKMQQKDNETVLALFLRNKSLADGVMEMQNFSDLNSNLAEQITNLQSLNTQLNQKLDQVSAKQHAIQEEHSNLKVRKLIVLDEKEGKDTLLVQTKNKEEYYQRQLTELEKQQNAVSDEIEIIENELRLKFDSSILPLTRPGVFAWPIRLASQGGNGYVTQHFGKISRLYRGKPHNGLDIGVPIGTPVYAADDGEVTAVDNNDQSRLKKYQYGKYVVIEHDNNLATLYAHLSSQVVRKGAAVRKGELIGYSGSTGYATGPHLHFGAYWAPSVFFKSIPPAAGLVPIGVIINPEDYL